NGVIHARVVDIFSQRPELPPRLSYTGNKSWKQMLDEASEVGLLTAVGGSSYAIHPALPAYLVNQWRAEDPDTYAEQHESARLALLHAYAAFADWASYQIDSADAAYAMSMIDQQRRTLGDLLGYALDNQHWGEAQTIAQALNIYWDARGWYREASDWADQARRVLETGNGTPPALDDPAGSLWLFLLMTQADHQRKTGQLDSAERTFLRIRDLLVTEPESASQRNHLAMTYSAFGAIANERGLFDDADRWYRKALTIQEELGKRTSAAGTYHNLGLVSQGRGDLDKGETWLRQALTILEELGDRSGAAGTYHQLGVSAQLRGQLNKSEYWHCKALTTRAELGQRAGVATSYLELGALALRQGQLDKAEASLRQALIITEELGHRTEVAVCCRQLGILARLQNQPDQAEAWFHQALTIGKQLGNRLHTAHSFLELGQLAYQRDRNPEALEWMVRATSLFDEVQNPVTQVGTLFLGLLTATLGADALERCWLKVTGKPVPAQVRAKVVTDQSHPTQPGEESG
ncbi:MAG: tetratricopeptide repeat protein, partial [Pseudonocardiaceae bacterium]